jgi:hypothetical protein
MRYEGHLYGHYDSRGGTSFVVASSRKEADKRYIEFFWPGDEFDFTDAAEEDHLGYAVIESDQPLAHGSDIDEGGDYRVFCQGAEEDEFVGKNSHELVRAIENPDGEEYAHPRWDDDAFSLIFINPVVLEQSYTVKD